MNDKRGHATAFGRARQAKTSTVIPIHTIRPHDSVLGRVRRTKHRLNTAAARFYRHHYRVSFVQQLAQQLGHAVDIESRVKQVLGSALMVDASRLGNDAKFVEDLGVSSLDRFELAMSLEEAFNIEMSQQDQESILTVGDAVQYIKDKTIQC